MENFSTQVSEHLSKLCVGFGCRPIGSFANQAAADYISSVFLSAGLNIEQQPYVCMDWQCESASLEFAGQHVSVDANVFSNSCDVTAPMVPVCSIRELELADIAGKIVLFYGDLANVPLSPKSWFLKSERDVEILQLLEASPPAALIARSAATLEYEQVTEDWELNIPAATVSWETADRLASHPGALVRLILQCKRTTSTAANIVARKIGRGTSKVVLMAHFDTKIATPGALDNATGVALLLTLAERLASSDLACGLEFVAFNGEEYLPIGDDEYLRKGEDDFGNILTAINMDGVGARLGTSSIAIFSASHAFHDQVSRLVMHYPGVVWVEPWPESNHSTFAFRGVPSLAFSSVGVRSLAHTQLDCIEQVSPVKLAEVAELVTEIVHAMQGKTAAWSRD
jgi:aminopeptidase YwaD